MIIALFRAAALAQAPDLAAPPRSYETPRVRADCICQDDDAADIIRLEGLVVDAEVTLSAGGRAANDRQATVFDVSGGDDAAISGRTRIWHSTRTEDCGVTFDYGRKYSLAARRTDAGLLETDECLMRRAASVPDREAPR